MSRATKEPLMYNDFREGRLNREAEGERASGFGDFSEERTNSNSSTSSWLPTVFSINGVRV